MPAIIAGVVAGLVTTLTAISYTSLLFSGPLHGHVAQGITLGLFSALVFGVVVTLLSSFPGAIAIPQARIAPLMALMIGGITSQLGVDAEDARLFHTVVAALSIASLSTGLMLLLLGLFRAGRFIRFIPYPVVGGFLAGTGLLLVGGSFTVMTGQPPSAAHIAGLLRPGGLILWIPGSILAVSLIFILRRKAHFLTTPGALLGSIGLFYALLHLLGISIPQAMDAGLLLGPMPDTNGWTPITPQAMANADWSAIFGQTGLLLTIGLVSTLSLLLNASSMELAARADIDLNQELRAAGIANLISGAGGGVVGFHAVGASMLAMKLGTPHRIAGVISALLPALVLVFGFELVAYLPRFVVGGLLLYVGLSFLEEWVWDGYKRLSRADYAVVVVIVLTVGSVGYLEGIGVGMMAALVMFVVNYSRIDVIKQALNGALQQSNVDRPELQRKIIQREGEHTLILKLQGFIFFGTASGLLDRIRSQLDDDMSEKLRFVVLDFRAVTGFDSSAAISFVKLEQLAEQRDFTVLLCAVNDGTLRALHREGVDTNSRILLEPDLDHALEFTERQILKLKEVDKAQAATGFENLIRDTRLDEQQAQTLLHYMDRLELEAGESFIEQGSHSDALFFLEQGQVSVSLDLSDGRNIRLRTMGAGTIIGELGLYLNQPRSASVIADEPCVVLRMRSDDLVRLETRDPEVAAAFHRYMSKMIAERLTQTNRVLERVL